MKINRLEIENVKRIHAVAIEPVQDGLTIIGGKNRQGKTSVLDSIAWALGGKKFQPSQAVNTDSAIPPRLKVIMDNGLVVERKGKNSDLKVTDPTGKKGGQQLLDEFVEELALNLPKFMEASGKEKANTLLQIIGVAPQLAELDKEEKELYQERLYAGRIADQKEKFAAEQPYYPDAPQELVSPSELIRQQQDILARNGEKARIRANAAEAERKAAAAEQALSMAFGAAAEAEKRLEEAKAAYNKAMEEKETAFSVADQAGEDESTAELEENIANIEEINIKVRANMNKLQAEEDAKEYRDKYQLLTQKIEGVRADKTALLDNADLPLPGLSVMDGELIYNGQKWDNMSSAEQMIVSTSIVRKLNPKCGFVLLDKLEVMDLDTLKDFGAWLEQEGLQAIATRVSTGDECSIIITDGYTEEKPKPEAKGKAKETPKEAPKEAPKEEKKPAGGWNAGMGF